MVRRLGAYRYLIDLLLLKAPYLISLRLGATMFRIVLLANLSFHEASIYFVKTTRVFAIIILKSGSECDLFQLFRIQYIRKEDSLQSMMEPQIQFKHCISKCL